jgi:hypothetical protein
MRCKVGDLAVIVQDPDCGNRDLGKLVEVLRRTPDSADEWECRSASGPLMHCGREGFDIEIDIPDGWLRPIRDNDGEDEMIRIAGIPNGVPA